MRFAATIIYVPDVPAALAFYEIGFGLAPAFISEEGDYGELETGDVRLGFDSEELADRARLPDGYRPNRASDPPPGIEIMLTADDVPGAVKRATDAGAQLLVGPDEKPWGQTIAYVRDPWGTLVALGTPWSAPGV